MRILTLFAAAFAGLSTALQASTTNLPPSPIKQIWGGGRHTMALLADGSVWTWGSDVARKFTDGSSQFTFTNSPGARFTVLTAINPALALTNWTVLGSVPEISPGEFQFTDSQTASSPQRFYRVQSP